MYKNMWEGEGDRKDFIFQLYFLSHQEDSPAWSLSCLREGERVERTSVTNVSTIPQLSQLFAWVSSGKLCFGSSWLQGTLVGPGCPAAMSSSGEWHLSPACASICPKSLHAAFCRDPPIASSPGWPPWYGSEARCQTLRPR